jgi:DNA-binding transcriptional ArsR family regulator
MMNEFKPVDKFLIKDVETLKVITNPIRTQILMSLASPRTVKQIAAKLALSPNKLYYHVNLLEEHGLIVVVEKRVVSNIIEKVYQAAAVNFEVEPALFSLSENEESDEALSLIGSVLDQTRDELARAMRVWARKLAERASCPTAVSRALCVIPESRVSEFQQRIETLMKDFQAAEVDQDAQDEDVQAYAMTVVFYPYFSSL